PPTPLPNPHARIPAVAEEVADVLGPELPLPPGLKVGGQPSHQTRDRVLPEWPAAQQRRQRALEPPRVAPAQVDAEDRLVDPGRPPLVPRHRGAGPLGRAPVLRRQPGAGHGDRRRPETRGECPRPRPVSIAGPPPAPPPPPGTPQRPPPPP